MPQMSPMMWLMMFILFSMIFIMFNMMNYYSNINNPPHQKLMNTKINKTLNWKW